MIGLSLKPDSPSGVCLGLGALGRKGAGAAQKLRSDQTLPCTVDPPCSASEANQPCLVYSWSSYYERSMGTQTLRGTAKTRDTEWQRIVRLGRRMFWYWGQGQRGKVYNTTCQHYLLNPPTRFSFMWSAWHRGVPLGVRWYRAPELFVYTRPDTIKSTS